MYFMISHWVTLWKQPNFKTWREFKTLRLKWYALFAKETFSMRLRLFWCWNILLSYIKWVENVIHSVSTTKFDNIVCILKIFNKISFSLFSNFRQIQIFGSNTKAFRLELPMVWKIPMNRIKLIQRNGFDYYYRIFLHLDNDLLIL